MAAVTICSDFGSQEKSLSLFPLFPHLSAMKWWNQMPWSSFFECWVLSQLFHSPLSLSSRGYSYLLSSFSFFLPFVCLFLFVCHLFALLVQSLLPSDETLAVITSVARLANRKSKERSGLKSSLHHSPLEHCSFCRLEVEVRLLIWWFLKPLPIWGSCGKKANISLPWWLRR